MSCNRYEDEGLTGFPATPELTAHLAGCAECQAAQESFARLEKLVAVAGSQAAPRAGWEQRLDERLKGASRRRFSLRSLAVIGSAVAATLVAVVFFPRRGPAGEAMQQTQTELIEATGIRGTTASVGGTWKVSADQRQEIRVWRNQKILVMRCAVGDPGCEVAGGLRIANVQLRIAGEYRAMVITPAAAPLSEPVSFDEDARLVREAGATYSLVEPIVVR